MKSADKIDVRVELVRGKPWAKVYDRLHGKGLILVPSFEDVVWILAALMWCERKNFPDLRWDPAEMVAASVETALELLEVTIEWPPTEWRAEQVLDRFARRFKLQHRRQPLPPSFPRAEDL